MTPASENGAEQETLATLERMIARAEGGGVPARLVDRLRRLAEQVGEPCLVATVGPVNAGKSSFLNALLGEDRAVVGTTETTATINFFVHGEPAADRPVRCHWRSGQVTEEPEGFLAALQGSDLETLRRADGINHLEFLLPNSMLRRTRLVDTPGTGAAVTEHRAVTAEFLALERRVRERHDDDTRRIRDQADAIVYLTGPVALERDRELLSRFESVTGGGSRPVNAMGVIAKIDLADQVLERRHELAAKISGQLRSTLNVVLPVSAGLARTLQRTAGSGVLEELAALVARLGPDALDLLLGDEELFCDFDRAGIAVATSERRRVREACGGQWRVFATIARTAARFPDPGRLTAELEALAGMEQLRATLDRHFLQRGHVLRSLRIARDARAVVNDLRFSELPAARARARSDRVRRDRFAGFVARAAGDPRVAKELLEFLAEALDPHSDRALDKTHKHLDVEISRLLASLEEHDADLGALQILDDAADSFPAGEQEELRSLLGLYGGDARIRLGGSGDRARCLERQVYWRGVQSSAPRGSARRAVAGRAQARLGLMLAELG